MTDELMVDKGDYFKQEEIDAIIDCANSLRNRTLLQLLYKSGRRVSEILMLRVGDIDFEDFEIVWNILKKNKLKQRRTESDDDFNQRKKAKHDKIMRERRSGHTVKLPMDRETIGLLSDYISEKDLRFSDLVFPISKQRVDQLIKIIAGRAGIVNVGHKKPHAHAFRHSFAINSAKRLKTPADLEKLRRWLQHSNLGMTQQYLDFRDDLRELVEEDNVSRDNKTNV